MDAFSITLNDNIPLEKQLFSLGRVCHLCGHPPSSVRLAAKASGVVPCLVLDDVPYFDGNAVISINRELKQSGAAK